MPKVSVIIPVYGVEKYIERCARSLFEQTLDDIEYLFIDDCTPDKSVEILRSVLEEFPHRKEQVLIHKMERNSGQALVREWGMKNAKGDYVIHCDSDDWPEKDQYEIMYKTAIDEDADMVFCDHYLFYPGGERVLYQRNINFENRLEIVRKMLEGYCGINQLWACMVSRNLINKISFPKGNQGEDQAMMFQFVYYCNKIKRIEKPLYNYYINPNSIVRISTPAKIIERATATEWNVSLVISFLEKNNLTELFSEQIISYKFKPRAVLSICMYSSACRQMWYGVFPEINGKILKNRYISKGLKIKEVLMRCHLGLFYGCFDYFIKNILKIKRY